MQRTLKSAAYAIKDVTKKRLHVGQETTRNTQSRPPILLGQKKLTKALSDYDDADVNEIVAGFLQKKNLR